MLGDSFHRVFGTAGFEAASAAQMGGTDRAIPSNEKKEQ